MFGYTTRTYSTSQEYVATSGDQIQYYINSILSGSLPYLDIVIPQGLTITLNQPIIIGKIVSGAWQQTIGITIRAQSQGIGFYDAGTTNAPKITASYSDKPLIILQNCRACRLKGLKLFGISNYASNVNSAWYIAGANNAWEDRIAIESNHASPTNAARTNRYSPAACIAVDPFGTVVLEANRYPGLSANYLGDVGSSGCYFEDIVCSNNEVGIVFGLGTTGNSSEMHLNNFWVHGVKYGISCCHAQVKNIHIKNLSFFANWAVITSGAHGAQAGPLPLVDHIQGSQSDHLIEMGGGSGGPAYIRGGLIESIMRISTGPITGNIGSASSAQGMPSFELADLTINYAGLTANTAPIFYAGTNPFAIRRCMIFPGDSARKAMFNTSGSFTFTAGNLFGSSMIIEDTQFRQSDANSVSSVSDVIGLTSGHSPSWLLFKNSSAVGIGVATQNTRLIPLDSRGGGL